MPDQGILEYIRAEKARGVDAETTRNELLKAGWKVSDIEVAFRAMTPEPTVESHPTAVTATDFSKLTEHKPSPTTIALQSVPKFKSKRLIFELFAVILIVLAGGGITYGYYYHLSPYLVLNKSMGKLSEVKTFEYSLTISNTDTSNKYDNFTLQSRGVEDITDLNNTKSSITLSGTSADDSTFTNPIGFQIDYRNISHNIYAKVDKLDGLEDLAAPIFDKWIKFDLTPIKEQYDLDKVDEPVAGSKDASKISSDQKDKLYKALKADKVFDFSERLLNEKVNGVDATHYQITLNKEGFLEFYTDAAKILFDREFTNNDIKSMRQDLRVINSADIEIWIGKNDSLPYKIVGSSQIVDPKTSKITGSSTLTLNFKNFNKSVTVATPTDTISFEEAFGLLFK